MDQELVSSKVYFNTNVQCQRKSNDLVSWFEANEETKTLKVQTRGQTPKMLWT